MASKRVIDHEEDLLSALHQKVGTPLSETSSLEDLHAAFMKLEGEFKELARQTRDIRDLPQEKQEKKLQHILDTSCVLDHVFHDFVCGLVTSSFPGYEAHNGCLSSYILGTGTETCPTAPLPANDEDADPNNPMVHRRLVVRACCAIVYAINHVDLESSRPFPMPNDMNAFMKMMKNSERKRAKTQ